VTIYEIPLRQNSQHRNETNSQTKAVNIKRKILIASNEDQIMKQDEFD
jgi:hypothetical protein